MNLRVCSVMCVPLVDRDELLEVTPNALRLRKKILDTARRPRRDGPKKA